VAGCDHGVVALDGRELDKVLAGQAEGLEPYAEAVERRITPLTRAGWGAKHAFERFPRRTYALARLPVTFRALEKSADAALKIYEAIEDPKTEMVRSQLEEWTLGVVSRDVQ